MDIRRIDILPVYERPPEHFFINIDVLLGGDPMIECSHAFCHYSSDLPFFDAWGHHIKLHGLINGPGQTARIECFEQKPVARIFRYIQMCHRIVNTPGIMSHRKGTVDGPDHLGKTAGFEA